MSALPLKAAMLSFGMNVCFVPEAGIEGRARSRHRGRCERKQPMFQPGAFGFVAASLSGSTGHPRSSESLDGGSSDQEAGRRVATKD